MFLTATASPGFRWKGSNMEARVGERAPESSTACHLYSSATNGLNQDDPFLVGNLGRSGASNRQRFPPHHRHRLLLSAGRNRISGPKSDRVRRDLERTPAISKPIIGNSSGRSQKSPFRIPRRESRLRRSPRRWDWRRCRSRQARFPCWRLPVWSHVGDMADLLVANPFRKR